MVRTDNTCYRLAFFYFVIIFFLFCICGAITCRKTKTKVNPVMHACDEAQTKKAQRAKKNGKKKVTPPLYRVSSKLKRLDRSHSLDSGQRDFLFFFLCVCVCVGNNSSNARVPVTEFKRFIGDCFLFLRCLDEEPKKSEMASCVCFRELLPHLLYCSVVGTQLQLPLPENRNRLRCLSRCVNRSLLSNTLFPRFCLLLRILMLICSLCFR